MAKDPNYYKPEETALATLQEMVCHLQLLKQLLDLHIQVIKEESKIADLLSERQDALEGASFETEAIEWELENQWNEKPYLPKTSRVKNTGPGQA